MDTSKPTKEETKKSSFKLRENFVNKVENVEKNINNEIFKEYFGYSNPSFSEANPAKTEQLINQVNNALIDLRKDIIRKAIPKNESPDKVINIIEKILDFDKQKKGNRLKILTHNQMFQRFPIAVAQIKAGDTSLKLPNDI